MEIAFIIISILITLFAILALYDGFYLHIFKYKLHHYTESRLEHLTHTVRAIFFPLILYFLFIKEDCTISFFIGVLIVILDLLVLAIDAYSEKDSRKFMDGLPRWEYILHLFVNGFHFASIAVFLSIKIRLENNQLSLIQNFNWIENHTIFLLIVKNLMPGSIILAIIHLMTLIPASRIYWDRIINKVKCC